MTNPVPSVFVPPPSKVLPDLIEIYPEMGVYKVSVTKGGQTTIYERDLIDHAINFALGYQISSRLKITIHPSSR